MDDNFLTAPPLVFLILEICILPILFFSDTGRGTVDYLVRLITLTKLLLYHPINFIVQLWNAIRGRGTIQKYFFTRPQQDRVLR